MRPKVSVIVPVYNVQKYLGECLDSVLMQSLEQIEVICVDDDSKDNSKEILQSYALKDTRLVIVSNRENRGLSYTRNVGIKHATGEYICFLDSDDMLKAGALEELYFNAVENKTDVVFFNLEMIAEDCSLTEEEKKYCSKGNYVGIKTGVEFALEMIANNEQRDPVWLQFWNHDSYKKYSMQFIEGIYHEDVPFTLRGLVYAERVSFINHQLYIYRRCNNSITKSKINSKYVESYIIIYQYLLELWKREKRKDSEVIFQKYLQNSEHAIIRYVMQLEGGVRYLKELWGESSELYFWLDLILKKYLLNIQGMISADKILQLLFTDKKIAVYGAGKIAMRSIKVLQGYGIRIDKIVVSEIEKNETCLLGIPICNVKTLVKNKEEYIVLVGVGKKYLEEIVRKLDELEFCNYITLN